MDQRRVHVIGASSGIGRALVERLAAQGHRVVASARRVERLAELATKHPELITADPFDLAVEGEAEAGVRRAFETLSGLDALVVAAGLPTLDSLRNSGTQTWRDVFEVNVVGPALAATEAARRMQPGGRVVFVSSCSAARAWPELVPYAAAKSALETMALGLQQEEPHLNVTVVALGPAATEAHSDWSDEQKRLAYRRWRSGGYVEGPAQMDSQDVAVIMSDLLFSPIRVPRVDLMPNYGATVSLT